ncbi:MAG: PKD domain-containing protein [Nanoarchaeota archaeon]|nr:PKD domain-containing protein [Nanoarchaeota archaeon]
MNKKTFIFITLLAFILLPQIGKSDLSKTISIELEYKSSTNWDLDNNGIESNKAAIDFTVEDTKFSWDADESKLCTRWEIYSIENEQSGLICYGNKKCCNFIDLEPEMPNWNNILYIPYQKYGTSRNNKVSATVIYVDYSLDPNNLYSDIYYSELDYLYAVYLEENLEESIPKKWIVIKTSSENSPKINFTIISPNNKTSLIKGEDVYLNFTLNITVMASYSLNSGNYVPLGLNNSFSSKLNGSLPFDVIGNGRHNLTIYLMDNLSDIINYTYSFTVNDTLAPDIYVNVDGIELNNSIVNRENHTIVINIISDEYSSISYKLNDDEYQNTNLDENKSVSINAELQDGKNNLTININDMQGNSRLLEYGFNFELLPTCTDGVQNGDETSIDCGGSCEECIPFDVSLEKYTFDLGETVEVTILARANSAVDLKVLFNGNVIDSEYIPSYSPDFPIYITKTINNIDEEGNYEIQAAMYYMNTSENKVLSFYVNDPAPQNPLSVSIKANTTSIKEGEAIEFGAAISGNTSAASFNWRFDDGSTSTQTNPKHTYNQNKTYTVNLTITWNGWTKTDKETITVKEPFKIIIEVENEDGRDIENAEVEFDDIKKNTSSDGKASFIIAAGTYDFTVSKENYIEYSNSTKITENKTIRVKLTEYETYYGYDNKEPAITLSGPADNEKINQEKVTINYKVLDSSAVNCTLYINIDEGWWVEKAYEKNITEDSEISFVIDDLENKHYQWKIECVDKYGNSQVSETRNFNVSNTNIITTNQGISIDEAINKIGISISNLVYLERNEKEASDALKLKELLEKSIKNLERAKRDLNNIKWRKLNETKTEELRLSIIDRIENIKRSTPNTIKVIETKEFVGYPDKEDVRNISLHVLESENKKYKKREKEEYVSYNQELQNLISITTKSKAIEVGYISGETGRITLIEKEINIKESSEDLSLVESIPKAIAANTSCINALFDYAVILEDPMIRLNMPMEKYVYYVNKEIPLDKIKEIKSVLIANDIDEKTMITGFAVFGGLPGNLVQTSNMRLIIEILIIIILIIIYVAFTSDLRKLKYFITDRTTLKNIKEVNQTVDKALVDLQNNQYEKAKALYKNTNTTFKQLPEDMRKDAYKKITHLSGKLNVFHINKLIDKAFFSLENHQVAAASSAYKHVNKIYKVIAPRYKSNVLERCNELYKKLNEQKK